MRRFIAEFAGTFILVLFGVGSAVFGYETIGPVGVALAFGFVLLALAYTIGPISGAHVNPAVTIALVVARKISPRDAGGYIVAQFLGGIAAAGVLKWFTTGGGVKDQTGGLGSNGWGDSINGPGAFVAEVLLTFLLVFVVLAVINRTLGDFDGLAIGLALAVIHLVGIPLTGTSVNPARSLGPALFAGGESLSQVWLFLVAPIVGAGLATVVWPLIRGSFRTADTVVVQADGEMVEELDDAEPAAREMTTVALDAAELSAAGPRHARN
ncbi:MIP/aquaporin family protein [Longispora albida]|uniref:MIP/aquaporin family protein n=1 Tax=Longispora albida TaxID=203523 RepID=UPI00035EAE73|nr:MIP family channel protein [Longispora albida]